MSLKSSDEVVLHLDDLLKIDEQNFGPASWKENAFLADFPNKWKLSMVAFVESQVVGYLIGSSYLMDSHLCTHVNRISVDKRHAPKGTGTSLMQAFEENTKLIGATFISLEFADNLNVIDVYRRCGYSSVLDTENITLYLQSKNKWDKQNSFLKFSTHLMLKRL